VCVRNGGRGIQNRWGISLTRTEKSSLHGDAKSVKNNLEKNL
jgi:hypothetical protein